MRKEYCTLTIDPNRPFMGGYVKYSMDVDYPYPKADHRPWGVVDFQALLNLNWRVIASGISPGYETHRDPQYHFILEHD